MSVRDFGRPFRVISAIILAIAFASKTTLFLTNGQAIPALDPVLLLNGRIVAISAILSELLVFLVLCLNANRRLQLLALNWLGCVFLCYRIGLFVSGAKQPCNCLGILTQFMKNGGESLAVVILIFFVAGSSFFLRFESESKK